MARSLISDAARLLFAALLVSDHADAHAAGREVVFWTADDCSWCTAWKQSDRVAEFQATATPLAIRLITVRKPRLEQPVRYFEFPDGMERPAIEQRPIMLPAFDFLCDGQPVKRLLGVAAWDSYWNKTAQQLVRDCPSQAR